MKDDIGLKADERQFESLIVGLLEQDYGCVDNFLEPLQLAGLRANLDRLQLQGSLDPAGVGNQHVLHQDQRVRGDKITWLEDNSTDPFEISYLRKMAHFVDYLNRTCFTSITTFESHYAQYEKNSFYKRHIDQFKSDQSRKYSVVFYLNADWLPEDGGCISLYPQRKAPVEIAPLEGRLIFFRSDNMEHEVHPSTTRSRQSIAGWLKS